MKSNFKRRSAFAVYKSQFKKEAETLQQEEEKSAKTLGTKKRRHEDNSASRPSKKFSKVEETNGKFDHEDHSLDIVESKQRGKGKLLSKANKLRQSLTLSSRKKKRQGYQSYAGDLDREKSSSNLTVHSMPEKAECSIDNNSANGKVEHHDRLNLQEGEMEADRMFSWLISPVKPGKFFRYM